MTVAMDAMGPEMAAQLVQTPMYETYRRIAPRVEDWPVLVRRLVKLMKVDHHRSAETPGWFPTCLDRLPDET